MHLVWPGCRESGGHGAAAGAAAAALQPAARGAALGVAAHPRRRSGHRQRPHPRPARPGPAPASPARRLPRRAQGRRPRAGVAVAARAGPWRPPRLCAVIAAPSGSSCGQRPGGTGTERTERAGTGGRRAPGAGDSGAPAVSKLWMASCGLDGAFHMAWPGLTPRESMNTGRCSSSLSWISISDSIHLPRFSGTSRLAL